MATVTDEVADPSSPAATGMLPACCVTKDLLAAMGAIAAVRNADREGAATLARDMMGAEKGDDEKNSGKRTIERNVRYSCISGFPVSRARLVGLGEVVMFDDSRDGPS